jgi:hypothetical protein
MVNWLGYDSNEPYTLKHHVPHPQFVWRYGNGIYAWPQHAGLFPGVPNATIDVLGDSWQHCDELQIDGTPDEISRLISQARRWVEERHKIGPATVYVDRWNLPAVQHVLRGLEWWLHLSTLDGTIYHSPPGDGSARLAAVQCWGEQHLGFHADQSVIVSREWYTMHGGKA